SDVHVKARKYHLGGVIADVGRGHDPLSRQVEDRFDRGRRDDVDFVVVKLRDVSQLRGDIRNLVLKTIKFRHVADYHPHVDGLEIENVDNLADRAPHEKGKYK